MTVYYIFSVSNQCPLYTGLTVYYIFSVSNQCPLYTGWTVYCIFSASSVLHIQVGLYITYFQHPVSFIYRLDCILHIFSIQCPLYTGWTVYYIFSVSNQCPLYTGWTVYCIFSVSNSPLYTGLIAYYIFSVSNQCPLYTGLIVYYIFLFCWLKTYKLELLKLFTVHFLWFMSIDGVSLFLKKMPSKHFVHLYHWELVTFWWDNDTCYRCTRPCYKFRFVWWNNNLQVDVLHHSNTLLWIRDNQSFLSLFSLSVLNYPPQERPLLL